MTRSLNYVLTDAKLRAVKPKDKPHKVRDGGGLFVRVSPAGTKAWCYAYSMHGKARELGLGSYPEVSIKDARTGHEQARKDLANGIDPAAKKKEDAAAARRRAEDGDGTFESFAKRWVDGRADQLTERYVERLRTLLKRDVYPAIGKRRLEDVKPADVLAIIQKKSAPTTAAKIRSVISDIYDTAISTLRAEVNPATPLRKAVQVPTVTHFRHLSERELGAFWRALDELEHSGTQPSTIAAARFIALTAVRKGEALGALWSEFDLPEEGDATWTIPAARMKMRDPHRVPLSPQAVAVLRKQKHLSSGPYVFTAFGSSKPLAVSTINLAFRRMQIEKKIPEGFAPHGLRGTAATILRERGFSREVVELILAHAERGVAASYHHHELVEDRRKALDFYANLIDTLAAGDNVVPIKKRA
jgi:integrase